MSLLVGRSTILSNKFCVNLAIWKSSHAATFQVAVNFSFRKRYVFLISRSILSMISNLFVFLFFILAQCKFDGYITFMIFITFEVAVSFQIGCRYRISSIIDFIDFSDLFWSNDFPLHSDH